MTETVQEPKTPKPRRKGLLVAAIAVPLVIVLGGGAYAWQRLAGGGPQPDEVLPASVMAYARLDADPSASQKIKLFRLIKKSPEVAKELGITTDRQDLRKEIVGEALGDCPHIDYNKDIKPWLGDRVGIGLNKDGKTGLLAIRVTDQAAARKGIDLAAGCLGITDPGVAFNKGYALVGEGQKAVDAAARMATKAPLSKKAAFTEDMQSLGDPGIASAWVDIQEFEKFLGPESTISVKKPPTDHSSGGAREAFDDRSGARTREAFAGQSRADTKATFANARSAAVTLRAGKNSIELSGIGHTINNLGEMPYVDLGALPKGSVFAASSAGGGKQVDKTWSTLTENVPPKEVESGVSEIEKATGLTLPGDLKTLLGDSITLVMGDRDLEAIPDLDGPQDLKKIDVALAMRSNRKDATELARRIAAKVSTSAGINLAVVSTKDGAVLATNRSFGKSFEHGKKLRDSNAFSGVIDQEKSAYGGFFLDIAKIVKAARSAELSAQDKDDLDQVKHLNSLGLWATKDGDRVIQGTLKLSFD